jgi:hypothetical protein
MSQTHGFTRSTFTRKAGASSGASSSTPSNVHFVLTAFKDVKLDTAGQYLVKGLLPRKGVVVVWGPPKCGKSFWTFDVLIHVALGREYRGLKVKKGCVVYCALEGEQGFTKRIEAFRQNKLNGESEPPFHLMTTPLMLITKHSELIADIRAQTPREPPAVICIDTLNRSLEGSESSDEDMAAYIRAADALREAFDCLVVIVHHCGHGGERPRGHSSLIGALDVQIAVRRDSDDNVVTELELSKDGDVGLTLVSRLEQVQVGVDNDGDVIFSCVVEAATRAGKPKPKAHKVTGAAQIALNALRKALDEMGQAAPGSNTIPSNVRVVTLDQWRVYAYRSGVSEGDDESAKRKAFARAHERLLGAGLVGAWTDYRWLV